jgi:hypothetical protein
MRKVRPSKCRRLQVPVKDYVLAVLPGMRGRKHSEVAQLTPAQSTPPHAANHPIRLEAKNTASDIDLVDYH